MSQRIRAAVLVDAAFYLHHYRRHYRNEAGHPTRAAEALWLHCLRHLEPRRDRRGDRAISDACRLYRIFVYDCPPPTKKAHNPISGKAIDFSKTPQALFLFAFHDELKKRQREGVDFVLDPLFKTIRAALQEHVDAVRTPLKRPNKASETASDEAG